MHIPTAGTDREIPPVAVAQQPPSTAGFTWREMVRFVSIVLAILLAVNAFVCATWSFFLGPPGWLVWQIVPGALPIVFVAATILRFRAAHPLLRMAYAVSASWLGVLNLAFFAAVACWIIDGVASVFNWPLERKWIASILFGAVFVGTVYGLINARVIRVRHLTVRLPHLPEAWRGRRAALLTDLHLGPLSGAAFLEKVIARLRSLRPDLVFISGDMFDGPTLELDRLLVPWREFAPQYSVYFVTGNHDEFAERRLYLDPVERAGLRVLNNEMVLLDGLQLIGVHDSEAGDPAQLRASLQRARIDPNLPSILLAHRPINLAVAEQAGISLQLSGHTHRGQIWPWNLLVARIYGKFAYGLQRLQSLQVYTSSGVGTWGPPLRIATQSEIVLLQFEA